jgi:hypothetical protein
MSSLLIEESKNEDISKNRRRKRRYVKVSA